jgi:hypothetical protein
MNPAAALIAQSSGDIGAQAVAAINLLLTPTGLVAAVIGLVVVAALFVSRAGTELIGASGIFLLSMMRLESKYADNTLIQPLQTLRDLSRPIALVLVILLAMRALTFPRGERRTLVAGSCAVFLAFDCYFIAMLGLFADATRASLSLISVVGVFLAFTLGLGKLLRSQGNGNAFVRMFIWAGLIFIAANFLQLGLGYSNAVIRGRLGGISGNPQQLAATCCAFTIFFCYLFATSRARSPLKWLAAASIGIMALFVVWSGSRTGAASFAICLLGYFRGRIGRLAIVMAVAALILLALSSVFSESTVGTDRFFYGADTRTAVWLDALDLFRKAPILGGIVTYGDEGLNYSESSYIRALAMLGLVGGAFMLAIVISLLRTAWRCWRIGLGHPELAPHGDIVIASTAFLLFVNTFEGFMFGVLTFFTVFIYAVFALSAYVSDAGAANEQRPEVTDDGPGWASISS